MYPEVLHPIEALLTFFDLKNLLSEGSYCNTSVFGVTVVLTPPVRPQCERCLSLCDASHCSPNLYVALCNNNNNSSTNVKNGSSPSVFPGQGDRGRRFKREKKRGVCLCGTVEVFVNTILFVGGDRSTSLLVGSLPVVV